MTSALLVHSSVLYISQIVQLSPLTARACWFLSLVTLPFLSYWRLFLHFDRIASTFIHGPTPLSSGFGDQDVGVLKLENGLAKLVFVPLGIHDHLLQENPSAQVHMKGLLYHVCKELLHPEGTVLVSLPVPIYKHQRCIVGEFATLNLV